MRSIHENCADIILWRLLAYTCKKIRAQLKPSLIFYIEKYVNLNTMRDDAYLSYLIYCLTIID